MTDTIYAPATPPGRGAVAIVRVSGPGAQKSLKYLINNNKNTPSRQALLRTLIHPVSRETIDKALLFFFPGPHSYTGEDIVEYHLHGGPAVVRDLLDALSRQAGHRIAEPGEFTRRAFENGKMDLTAAEAVADLIDAETGFQKTQALEQLEGRLSALYDEWRERLTRSLAHLEADIEFPDEDLLDGILPKILPVLEALSEDIADHLRDNRRGERLRDGIRIAIIGAPNAGKSSLLNALTKRDVAIVSEHAGTTRDVIEVHLDLNGYPVILSDTAGLRPDQLGDTAQDSIESEGIRRALDIAKKADITLLLFDSTDKTPNAHTKALIDDKAVIALNKSDLNTTSATPFEENAIMISARTEEGLDDLLAALTGKIEALLGSRDTPSLTRARHREALEECQSALARALGAPLPELIAEDTRLAIRALGCITGRVDVEDVLDVVFRDFCVGK